MFLIVEQNGIDRAFWLDKTSNWDLWIMRGRGRDQYIALEYRGKRYLLLATRTLVAEYPRVKTECVYGMCLDMIRAVYNAVLVGRAAVEFSEIVRVVLAQHRNLWRAERMIPPEELERHRESRGGNPLTDYARSSLPDTIVMPD
jgi:hypothetical protein